MSMKLPSWKWRKVFLKNRNRKQTETKKSDGLIDLSATDNESESDFSDCSVTSGLHQSGFVAVTAWMI